MVMTNSGCGRRVPSAYSAPSGLIANACGANSVSGGSAASRSAARFVLLIPRLARYIASVRDPILMPGIPELVVLRLLARQQMYGYEIARMLKVLSQDTLSLGEGVLYPALHAMEARGLLRARPRRVDGRTRIYYQLTSRGRHRLERLTASWRRTSAGVERILGVADHE